jgi:threonine aldolase
MKYIDLRSDTITKPTKEMRKAIYEAEVGDDVYREDPSVNKLECLAAEITNKESSLFVPSGSMGNLLSLWINGGATTEVICASNSHIIQHEIGACSSIASILPIYINSKKGILKAQDFEPLIKQSGIYDMARTSILEVENTIGGAIYPISNLKEIKALAEKNNLKVHMDGARLLNASVASKTKVDIITQYCDTVTFCLSKGLGAPMGSMLCGTKDFINEARRYRKMLGSGMRQIGLMAAAGIFALNNNIERLEIDHLRAKEIANVLKNNENIILQDFPETNIVFFNEKNKSAQETINKLKDLGVLANNEGTYVRLVTNLNISDEDMLALLKTLEKL